MNITPLNLVSFKGHWERRDVPLGCDLFGTVREYIRYNVYRPDVGESRESIAARIAKKEKQFSGAKKTISQTRGRCTNFYTNIVIQGKRFLSREIKAALEKKTLMTQIRENRKRLQQIANFWL